MKMRIITIQERHYPTYIYTYYYSVPVQHDSLMEEWKAALTTPLNTVSGSTKELITMPKKRRHIKKNFSARATRNLPAQISQIPHKKQPISDLTASDSEIIDQLPDSIRALLMDWYERGIRRGLKKATDLMLEDQIFKEDGILHAPKTININLKTRCGEEEWKSRSVIIGADEIGFER